ncbi:MAG: ferrochelatase [Anaplasmataceae bacterium]|nr:ferrochelatase [Anaplasmataceae bacterium]
MHNKIAVVLYNLGGPTNKEEISSFLFNLFNDRNIITLPQPFRFMLAFLITFFRRKKAEKIYSLMGNKSPILEETISQASALQKILPDNYIVMPAMRYTKPNAKMVYEEIKKQGISRVILMPLYPQYSTTTTYSFIEQFKKNYNNKKTNIDLIIKCCYFNNKDYINAYSQLILLEMNKALKIDNEPIILFSAHSLPQKIIDDGDPYQWQIEQSSKNIIAKLEGILNIKLKWQLCYQSKVGLNKWLTPSTEECIEKISDKPIVLVPISFVSEHSETLVELDIDYKKLAKNPDKYFRVPTLRDNKLYIEALKNICLDDNNCYLQCPEKFNKCYCSMENK